MKMVMWEGEQEENLELEEVRGREGSISPSPQMLCALILQLLLTYSSLAK